jgi:DNA ligase-1
MEEILLILKQIGDTASRNDKESILSRNKDNQLLRDILYFVYNPYIVTGLSEKKINKKVKESIHTKIEDIYGLIEYLKTHNTGADKDIAVVQEFISRQEKESQNTYVQITTKLLKIGITDKTINKVFGKDFIPSFNVMLAEKYFECENKVKGEFIIT